MNYKQYALFFGIALLIFVAYATLRPVIIGADSFAFIIYSCGHSPVGKDGGAIGTAAFGLPFSAWVFSALPCDMLLFKALACLNLLACTILLAKTGELFDKQNGWLLGLFVFFTGLYFSMMINFEEEQLSFVFLFTACYFLLRHIKEKRSWMPVWFDKNIFVGFLFLCLAGLFWKGAIFLLPVFGLYWLPAALLFLFSLFFIGELFFGTLLNGIQYFWDGIFLGKQVMQEHAFGIGFIHQTFLLFGLLNRNKFLWLAIIYALAIAFAVQRLALLALPFAGVAFVLFLKENPIKIISFIIKPHKFTFALPLHQVFCITALGFIVFNIFSLPNLPPGNVQVGAVQQGVLLANGTPICNDFGVGWLIKFYNGNTQFYSGFPDCNTSNWKGIVIDKNSAYSH